MRLNRLLRLGKLAHLRRRKCIVAAHPNIAPALNSIVNEAQKREIERRIDSLGSLPPPPKPTRQLRRPLESAAEVAAGGADANDMYSMLAAHDLLSKVCLFSSS